MLHLICSTLLVLIIWRMTYNRFLALAGSFAIGLLKEMTDSFFSIQDMFCNLIGIMIGFSIVAFIIVREDL